MTADMRSNRQAIVMPDQPVGMRSMFHAPGLEGHTLCGADVPSNAHVISIRRAQELGGQPCPLCIATVETMTRAR